MINYIYLQIEFHYPLPMKNSVNVLADLNLHLHKLQTLIHLC